MGMSIDKARSELIYGNPYTNKFAEALVVAISTMCKYQKIEQIVEAWRADSDIDSYDSMIAISEVLEDGNDRV